MTPLRHQIAWLLVGTMIATGFAGATAQAQDDEERDERIEEIRQEDRQKYLVEQQRQRLQMAYKTQFDRWFASQFRPGVGARDQLELRLARRLLELGAECHLTEAQTKKLELAGRGDIKRFMDRVNGVAAIMEDPKSSVGDLRAARREMAQLNLQAMQRIGDDSLFSKTLARILDQEQVASREIAFLQQSVVRHRAAVARATREIQANLGMNDDQCARLAALLLRETRPPRRFGNAPDVALVLFQASRLPEAKLRPIFDDAQWRIVSQWMAVYINGSSGKRQLTRNGFVFEDTADDSFRDRAQPESEKVKVPRKEGTPIP